MRVFLDNAATTPMDHRVIETMVAAMRDYQGNPSSIHNEGRQARTAIEQARKRIANHLNASIGEIFFTSGGTESNNMALKCAVRDLGVRRVITAATEHHAVLHPLQRMAREGQIELQMLALDSRGRIDLQQLDDLLASAKEKTLLAMMHANNEIGTMIDLQKIGERCREHGVYFHSDTVQTVGYYPIDVNAVPINFLTGSAHKFHGPKGVGFIYINNDNLIKPFIDGGAQERNMRGGTENLPGIIGMARALDLAIEEQEARRAQIKKLRDYTAERLQERFPDLEFNGDLQGTAHYKLLSVNFPANEKTDMLLLNLDIEGISVSGGSACSSGADAGSHVIAAIKPGNTGQTIRFSFSHENTQEEVDYILQKLSSILPQRTAV